MKPGISMHSLRTVNSTSSLRTLSDVNQMSESDVKNLMRMSSISACASSCERLNGLKVEARPQGSGHKQQRFTTPDIIITDENSVVHNELTYEKTDEGGATLLGRGEEGKETRSDLTRVYFRRWIILVIFASISLLSAFNWIEYNIIQDVTIHFYNQSLPEGILCCCSSF